MQAPCGLLAVTIPEGVTSIGERAFSYCKSLTSINLPEGLTSIGKLAFYGCSALTSITIPTSVKTIGYSAFRGCSGRRAVTMSAGSPCLATAHRSAQACVHYKAGRAAAAHRLIEEVCEDVVETEQHDHPHLETTGRARRARAAGEVAHHGTALCPSRAELLSGRYFHNLRMPNGTGGGCMHVATARASPSGARPLPPEIATQMSLSLSRDRGDTYTSGATNAMARIQ
mgnify:CR=1 FL=1